MLRMLTTGLHSPATTIFTVPLRCPSPSAGSYAAKTLVPCRTGSRARNRFFLGQRYLRAGDNPAEQVAIVFPHLVPVGAGVQWFGGQSRKLILPEVHPRPIEPASGIDPDLGQVDRPSCAPTPRPPVIFLGPFGPNVACRHQPGRCLAIRRRQMVRHRRLAGPLQPIVDLPHHTQPGQRVAVNFQAVLQFAHGLHAIRLPVKVLSGILH